MDDKMGSRNLAIGIVLSLQGVFGILGNFSLLFHYLLLYYNEGKLKTIDLILTHVFTANSLIIFSKGMLQILDAILFYIFSDLAGVCLSTPPVL